MKTSLSCVGLARVCLAVLIIMGLLAGTIASFAAQTNKPDEKVRSARKKENPKKSGVLHVSLVSNPTDVSYSGAMPSPLDTIYLDAVVDVRGNKDQIGQNTEDDAKPPIKVVVSEEHNPVEFVRGIFADQFQNPASAQRPIDKD